MFFNTLCSGKIVFLSKNFQTFVTSSSPASLGCYWLYTKCGQPIGVTLHLDLSYFPTSRGCVALNLKKNPQFFVTPCSTIVPFTWGWVAGWTSCCSSCRRTFSRPSVPAGAISGRNLTHTRGHTHTRVLRVAIIPPLLTTRWCDNQQWDLPQQ